MPQRRQPFSYGVGDGEAGAEPVVATPYSGTGTGTGTDPGPASYGTEFDQAPGALPAETPASLRRRLLPVAGTPNVEPDMLTAVQQLLMQRRGGM